MAPEPDENGPASADEDAGRDAADDDAGDDAADERRLFGERREEAHLYVAAGLGITRVEAADGRVGRFSLAARCDCTAIAARDGLVVAGTSDTVLLDDGGGFAPLGDQSGAGSVTAVGLDGDWFYQARASGAVRRRERSGESWESVGTVTDPRAIHGNSLAAADGVFRITDHLVDRGLDDVRDVAGGDERVQATTSDPGTSRPGLLAGTGEGLYRHTAGGWQREHETAVTVVVASGDDAFAVCEQGVLEAVDGDWTFLGEQPTDSLVDLAIADRLYGLSADGTIWTLPLSPGQADEYRTWRSFSIGVRDAVGLAIA